MRVTTKGRYALRALTNLALAESDKPIPIKRIAGDEEISPEFLEQI
ncbi:MAG: Rrf2 family transcriptional regulator, partial [Spirochaetia bacterium]